MTTSSVASPPAPTTQPYTVRRLPVAEWDRLRPLPFAAHGLPPPELTIVVVAEDAAGEIVGLWAAMTAVHLDGLWVTPGHRGTTIAGRLLKAMKAVLAEHAVVRAFTVISDGAVMALAHKAGFVRAPGDLWMLTQPLPDRDADAGTAGG